MLPVLIDLGFMKIYATGALWGLAAIMAGITASRAAFRKGFHPVWVWDLVAFAFLGGIVASRIGFFISKPEALTGGVLEIVQLWKGGMSLHWGVLGGFTVAYFHSRRHGISFKHFADVWTPALLVGLAISRFGCLLGGHCFGLPCEDGCFFGITYPTEPLEGVPTSYPMDGIARHPAQLYHVVANFIAYLILLRMQLKPVAPGRVFAGFFIFYSIGRFIVEYYRDDMVYMTESMTVAQVASIGMVIFGMILWWWYGRRPREATDKSSLAEHITEGESESV